MGNQKILPKLSELLLSILKVKVEPVPDLPEAPPVTIQEVFDVVPNAIQLPHELRWMKIYLGGEAHYVPMYT